MFAKKNDKINLFYFKEEIMRFVTLFLLLLFAPIMVFSQTILYEEYFTGGNFDNPWYAGFNTTGGGKNLSIKNMPGNPSGDTWVGGMSTWRVADTAGVVQSWSGDLGWTDCTYEAQVYLPATGGSPFSFVEYYAIEFRIDTIGNVAGYQFMTTFNPNSALSPRMRFRKRPIEDPGGPVIIHEWLSGDIPGGVPVADGWHKLAVKAEGNQFWFYFNDQEMPGCPYSDTTSTALLTSGPIGVYAFKMNFMGNPLDTAVVYIDDVVVTSTASGIEDEQTPNIVNDYQLFQNYPNPFNPSTTIKFNLDKSKYVKLNVYNTGGEIIKTLINKKYSTGSHQVNWDATDKLGRKVSAGVYLYSLQTDSRFETKKMILLK